MLALTCKDHEGRPHKHLMLHMPSDVHLALGRHGSITKLEAHVDDATADRCSIAEPPLAEQLFQSYAITASHEVLQAIILETSPGLQVCHRLNFKLSGYCICVRTVLACRSHDMVSLH